MGINSLLIDEHDIVKVNTTIPRTVRDYIKEKGYPINELIRLGALGKENNPQLIERIRFLEDRYILIEKKLDGLIVELTKFVEKKSL